MPDQSKEIKDKYYTILYSSHYGSQLEDEFIICKRCFSVIHEDWKEEHTQWHELMELRIKDSQS